MSFGVDDLRGGGVSGRLEAILGRQAAPPPGVAERVAEIVAAVRGDGDRALERYTRELDGVSQASPRVDPDRLRTLASAAPSDLRGSLQRAIVHVRMFHERQVQGSWMMDRSPGVTLGMRVRPIDAVGVYVPGGSAAYPSTVIMDVVPAQVAGVPRIVAATPPATFLANPAVACVLDLLGIREIYLVGGAQAIAALACGTGTIPRVDKIVGPGNAFVAEAKRQVFGQVGIDAIAGPSEVVVVADASARPAWVAADMLSQAEHDREASAVAVTWDADLAEAIAREVERQWAGLPARAEIARASLDAYGAVFLVASAGEACSLVNSLAPEHVELMVADPDRFAAGIGHAGALFLGPWTGEVAGDYLAGTNHVLPTHGTARFGSPLGVCDFQIRSSVLQYSREALLADAQHIVRLAEAEGLGAHAAAARIRMASASAGNLQTPVGAPGTAGVSPAPSVTPQVNPLAFVKPSVRALEAYHLEPHRAPVKLDQNENPHDLPADLKREVFERLRERAWCRYPEFVPARLLDRLARHVGWRPDGILAGNGSNELIAALLAVTVGSRAEVATVDPTFALYGLLVGVNEGRLKKVPLGADFGFDVDALQEAVATADLTVLCSPNNPTGRQLPRADLVGLLEAARGLVVLDEAYVEFAPDCMTDLVARYRHLVVLRTFSKARALAGLRIGYLVGDPALVREVAKAKLPYNLNVFSLAAAEVALEHAGRLQGAIDTLLGERARVASALRDMPGVEPLPTDANFMLVRTESPPRQVFDALLERGILVRDVSSHPALARHFRFNVGTRDENDRFLQALAAVL